MISRYHDDLMSTHVIEYPLILVNLKTYMQSTGSNAIRLAEIAQNVSEETGVCIAIAPQLIDLKILSDSVEIPIFAQHIDPITYGKNTGHILPEAVKSAGASGTLISHSEYRLELEGIDSRIRLSDFTFSFMIVSEL